MRIMTLLLAPLLIMGCAGTTTPRQTCVKPLPDGVSLDSLADSTVPAAFTTGDIDWQHGKLTLTVYSETLYDTASINHMAAGDTLMYEGKPMTVSTIERRKGAVIINGDVENGGACLTPHSGGTYRATTFDDYSVYTVKGKRSVALARGFVLLDCGYNPTDPVRTVRHDHKAYLDTLPDYRHQFSPGNTKVRFAHGEVKEISRRWTP